MGHSMGSLLAFTFASLFPDNVDLVVGIDALKPQIRKPDRIVANIEQNVKNLLIADKRNQENSEPPSYQYSELIDKLSEATFGSVTKEAAPFLLERAIKRSEKFPEKFFFARDSRLKHNVQVSFSQEIILELIKRLHMPYLFIKCKDSPFYEDKKYFDEAIEAMKANEKFEWHLVEGTHHAHLTSPEVMSSIISNFLDKNQAVRSKL
jgi:pimeloyl-ACP methyl ester carboxylesterase